MRTNPLHARGPATLWAGVLTLLLGSIVAAVPANPPAPNQPLADAAVFLPDALPVLRHGAGAGEFRTLPGSGDAATPGEQGESARGHGPGKVRQIPGQGRTAAQVAGRKER